MEKDLQKNGSLSIFMHHDLWSFTPDKLAFGHFRITASFRLFFHLLDLFPTKFLKICFHNKTIVCTKIQKS